MAEGRRPRVLILGEDALARAGLRALVASGGAAELAGEGAPAELARLAAAEPDVLLCDVGPAGAAWLAEALARFDRPLLAVLWDEAQAAEVEAAGALGLLLRAADAERLAAALLAVSQGLAVREPGLLRAPPPVPAPDPPPTPSPLTAREQEVLELLAEGLSNKAVAARLGISEHTAKFHVNAILERLGVDSRTEAIVLAVRRGLLVL